MRRRKFMSGLGGLALTSTAPSWLRAEVPELCGSPAVQGDGWPVVAADDDRLVDRAALCKLRDRLAAGSNVHAVLLARRGKLAFEQYFTGTDEVPGRFYGHRIETIAFDADTLHDVKSVTKSVVSLAFGIAVDRGLIRSINEPILNYFPELADLRSEDRNRIQLVHALTMSMGLKWTEATPETGDFENDEARMQMALDPNRFVLSLPVTAPAGKEFFYNTGVLRLLSAVLHKVTGRYLDAFVRETLFEPLGITQVEWNRRRGETDAGGGLRMKARDMARIGQLVLDGGRWNDRQIVSKEWIGTSTAAKIETGQNMAYGYLWWLGRTRHDGREIAWIGALGRGGQSIRIIPDLGLVTTVLAGYYQDYSPQAFKLQYSVFTDLVRASPAANGSETAR